MAWDTEATRRKLLDAGARQFSAKGFAGTSMDAIGRDSGVNKERVYQYFGNKREFFSAVLSDRLNGLLDDIEMVGAGAGAVGRYAGDLFDRYRASPELARLLAWESLELATPVSDEVRQRVCDRKAARIRTALPEVSVDDARQLLLTLLTLVAGWWTLAGVSHVVMQGSPDPDDRRRAIVRQITELAAEVAPGAGA